MRCCGHAGTSVRAASEQRLIAKRADPRIVVASLAVGNRELALDVGRVARCRMTARLRPPVMVVSATPGMRRTSSPTATARVRSCLESYGPPQKATTSTGTSSMEWGFRIGLEQPGGIQSRCW